MSTTNDKNPLRAVDVATHLISLVHQDEGDVITHLKLQKLLYYAQAYALAILDQPLFADPILRWQHGPVVSAVYYEYKNAGSAPLVVGMSSPHIPSPPLLRVMTSVSAVYGRYEASALRNMTHRESPWLDVADGEVISESRIKAFFCDVLSGKLATGDQRRRNALSVAYLAGKIDAVDVARALAMDVASVIVMFEEAGLARSFETTALDDTTLQKITAQIEAARGDMQRYDSPEWIGREVIASQRIEGLDARKKMQELLAHGG